MDTKTVIVQFRVTKSMYKELKKYAKENGLTISVAVRFIIAEKLFSPL